MCAEIMSTGGGVRVGLMLGLCQRVLDGKMPDERRTSVLLLIFGGK